MPTIKIVPFPGVPGPRGEQGPRGYQGETGLTGPAGNNGVTPWILGTYEDYASLSSVEGSEGALAFTSDGTLWYWQWADGFWVDAVSLVGPQGVQGDPGVDAPTPTEISYNVIGGAFGTNPTFNGDPLFDASYIEIGPLVHFRINVDFSNITSFGTGQYYVTLPFPSKYDIFLREGHLFDASTSKSYGISAHVHAGSDYMTLSYTSSSSVDESFTYNTPITLTTADHFHISGTFIKETA